MKREWSLLLFMVFSVSGYAQDRFTPVGVNWAGSEPCLYGDAQGICSQGRGDSAFLNRPSIVKSIGDDINRAEGLSGVFERVSDHRDQIWTRSANAREGIRLMVRSRYSGSPYAFGIRRGVAIDSPYERIFTGLWSATQAKLLLANCADYIPRAAGGKVRCEEIASHPEAAARLIPVAPEERIQFVTERIVGAVDEIDSALTRRLVGALGSQSLSSGIFFSSLEAANQGQDRMVTFRFSQEGRTQAGEASEIYLLAFEDAAVDPMADYNDYVVEVRLAVPAENP